MAKDRYEFDAELDISKFNTNWYDESILSTKPDERITARREARKAKYTKNADVKVITQEDIAAGKKKKKHKIRAGKFALSIAVLIFITAIVAVQGLRLTQLQLERRSAQAELEELSRRVEQLKNELSELDSREYIENAARSELHMIKNGEVMYIVNPGTKASEDDKGAK